jgi:hypothetical protein
MGYNTDFEGEFHVVDSRGEPDELTMAVFKQLNDLAEDGTEDSRAPDYWCQWVASDDGRAIYWNGGEKFYDYVEWIRYILDAILKPAGFGLVGEVVWNGEESSDVGKIIAKGNEIDTKRATITF